MNTRFQNLSMFTLLVSIALMAGIIYAQDSTPVPTKTPTSVASPSASPIEEVEHTPTVSSVLPDSTIEPFTQSDLTVLTGNVQRPNGAVWYDGYLYIACNGDWTLYELEAESGMTETYIFGVRNAHTLYAELDTNTSQLSLWVPDFEQNSLNRVTPNGIEPIVGDLEGPWGIAYVNESRFLITNLLSGNVVSVDRNGQVESILEGFRSPTGIAFDQESGIAFVANNGSARRAIEWFDLSADGEAEASSLVSGLQNTTGLVLASDGYLYFTYALGTRGVVGRVNPQACLEAGGCSNDQVEIIIYTDLAAPLAGLTISPDMRLYIHTIYRPEVYWIDIDS